MTGAISNSADLDPENKVMIATGINAKMAGCFRTKSQTPGVSIDDYVAYSRLGS